MKPSILVSMAICVVASATMAIGQTAAPASAPTATPAPPPSAPAKRSPAELEKLVMPIALHPDPLIAVLLPASVYPVEIVQAARFVKDTNNISKIDEQPWDDNVKAVAKIPQLIAQLDKDLNWTVQLGQAFLDQPKDVMDTIQALRGKAQTAGTLQTTPQQIVTVTNMVVERIVEQQTVVVTNTVVQIQPASTEVVYVPSYPPTVYYPPPGYVYSPYAPLVTFGAGMLWGAAIAGAWNNCNWGHGDIEINNVNVNRNANINNNRNTNIGDNRSSTRNGGGGQKWQPDQNRLRSSGSPSTASRDARGWSQNGAATSRASGANGGARASTTTAGARPSTTGSSFNRPSASTGSSFDRSGSSAGSSFNRPSSSSPSAATQNRGSSVGSRPSSSGSAFSGVNSGASTRSQSSRGASSMSGGGRSGGFGGGGGGRGGGGRGGGGRR